METWTPNLKIQGDKLPTCQRGLRDVVVEVTGQEESLTGTTTTTTPAPEESKCLFEISQDTLYSSLKVLIMFAKDMNLSMSL